MNFSLRITAALFLALTTSGLRAANDEGTWTVSPVIVSHYVFRGAVLADASFQPWVDYTRGPLSLGLWSSTALKDREAGGSDPEIDLYGSYALTLRDGAFSLVPGFYLYTYPDAERANGAYACTFEPSIAAVFSVHGVQFTPKIYYDVMLKGATYELTAAMAFPLPTLGTELDFSAVAGTFLWRDVTAGVSPDVKNWGDYWSFGVSVPVQVGVRSKVTLGIMYSEGRNNFYKEGTLPRVRNADARGQTAVSLSYGYTF